MNPSREAIARLLDRTAALDGAPDRRRNEWFYADLACLVDDVCDDAYHRGHVDGQADGHEHAYGYRDGLAAAHRQVRTSRRRVHATTAAVRQLTRRGDGGGRGGIA